MANPARVGDMAKQDSPHCHATIHPPAPTPAPSAHPALPLAIIPPGCPTVLIGSMPAARISDQTAPCSLPACVPGGPGIISLGAPTVLAGSMPLARVDDMTAHASCVAPIPGPVGKILPPGCPTVMVG